MFFILLTMNERETLLAIQALEHYCRYLDKLINASNDPKWQNERYDVRQLICKLSLLPKKA